MSDGISKLLDAKRSFVFVVCISLIIKLCLTLFTKVINPDGVVYITAAQYFASGDFRAGLAIYPMPSYSLLIVLSKFLVPDWIIAARLVNVAMSVLLLIPLYLLSKDLFDQRTAFWACAAFALSPLPNRWSVDIIRDPSFIFFFAWAAYFGHKALRSGRLSHDCLAGLFTTLSALFRIEGLIYFPGSILFLTGLILWKSHDRVARIKGVCVLITFPLTISMALVLLKGTDFASFNRLHLFIRAAGGLFDLTFLDNYKMIYEKLKAFENTLPYKSYGQGVIEIARHYMHTIYLIGLLEVFIKVLFPPYLLLVVLGLRYSGIRSGGFILFLVGCYLLAIYISHIYWDFVRHRFLYAPAFLLYPWIGLGVDRMFTFLKRSSRPRVLGAVILLVFVVLPVYRSVKDLWNQDDVVKIAGKWLAGREEFQGAKIIANDLRIPFYADRRTNYVPYSNIEHLSGMEKMAISEHADLMIISTSVRERDSVPQLQYFKKVREFRGLRGRVVIYASPGLQNDAPISTPG